MTKEVNDARLSGLSGNLNAHEQYQAWFNNATDQLPGVHHYSWFDINRKIKTYKNYWSKHWQSLYNISQEDTIDNNMFFDKTWEEVTESDIKSLSQDLAQKMGGWIFHQKVDFSRPTPHVVLKQSQPKLMKNE